MLTFDEIAEWAGKEGVVQVDGKTSVEWAISDAEEQALVEVGLPRFVDPFFEARVQSEPEPTIHSESAGELYQIGWDMGRRMGVAQGERGVYAIDPEGELPELFVNSSATELIEFLHHVGRLRQEYPRMTDEQIDAGLADVKARLTKIDQRAFANKADWWPQVFEQMELGMY